MPFGKRQKVTVRFPAFSSRQRTTSPARPSRWAGHEALVLEAAGQVGRQKTHAASTTVQRKGVWGKETLSPAGSRGRTVRGTVRSDPMRSTLILSPLVFFPLFLQRNRAPPGRAPFPPVPTAWGKPPAASPEKPKTIPAERPHRPPQGWFPRKNKGDQYPRSSPTRHTRVSPTPPRGRHSTDSPLQMRSGLRQS